MAKLQDNVGFSKADGALARIEAAKRAGPTQEEREQAVIEAARNLMRPGGIIPVTDAGLKGGTSEIEQLAAALRNLDAPQPVKPEEVEPGRLFRFFQDGLPRQCELPSGTLKLIGSYQPVGGRLWVDDDGMANFFHEDDLIIPLEGEELEDAQSRKAYEDTRDEESFTSAEVDAAFEIVKERRKP